MSFDRLHNTPIRDCQLTILNFHPWCCCHARAVSSGYGTIGMQHVKPQGCRERSKRAQRRDVQALGAYFWRTFLRLGDDDLRSMSICCISEGWLFMARRRGWKKECAPRSYFGTQPGLASLASFCLSRMQPLQLSRNASSKTLLVPDAVVNERHTE